MIRSLSILALLVAVGCSAPPAPPSAVPGGGASAARPSTASTNVPDRASAVSGPLSWDDLALRAAIRAPKAREKLLQAAAARYKTALDAGWRDPQFRYGHTWTVTDRDSPTGGKNNIAETGHERGDADTFGLRLHFSNPFVTHWVRRAGEASAGLAEAEAGSAAFAAACQVKDLCLEIAILDRELVLLQSNLVIRARLADYRSEQAAAAVGRSPLDELRAATAREELHATLAARRADRRELVREVAALAGLRASALVIAEPTNPPPPAASLDPARLTELALARRPDLAAVRAAAAGADATLAAAKARLIPWLDYLEGSYQNGDSTTRERSAGAFERSTEDRDQWQARLAVNLPIFTAFGGSVPAARAALEAAAAASNELHAAACEEVAGVLADYRAAEAERVRLAADAARFAAAADARLAELDHDAAAAPDEVLRTREELLGYERVRLANERAWRHQLLLLETVTGGPLAASTNALPWAPSTTNATGSSCGEIRLY